MFFILFLVVRTGFEPVTSLAHRDTSNIFDDIYFDRVSNNPAPIYITKQGYLPWVEYLSLVASNQFRHLTINGVECPCVLDRYLVACLGLLFLTYLPLQSHVYTSLISDATQSQVFLKDSTHFYYLMVFKYFKQSSTHSSIVSNPNH